MREISVSEEVWQEIAKRGKFGETEDDVLRRVFSLPQSAHLGSESGSESPVLHRSNGRPRRTPPTHPRRQLATRRMSAHVNRNALNVEFAGGPARSWDLPPRQDKASIRRVRDEAVAFAHENGATFGQENAVKKALTDAGYHLMK